MVNRFPLVLDADQGNRIKELPAGDNLNLRENSIVNVQDITSTGIIRAADIRINGERLKAQSILDLSDTPDNFETSGSHVLTVNNNGTMIEFRSIDDLDSVGVDIITVTERILPLNDKQTDIGSYDKNFGIVFADQIKGSIFDRNDNEIFNADTGELHYSALSGAPQFLSEFADDIGYLRIGRLNSRIEEYLSNTPAIEADIAGSVFSSDSSIIVDSLNFAIFSNHITLAPQTQPPENHTVGTIATADGFLWDPLQKQQDIAYPVFYNGENWVALS